MPSDDSARVMQNSISRVLLPSSKAISVIVLARDSHRRDDFSSGESILVMW
jgi:hypothetical protein